jgi:hypothetical protein
VWACQTHEKRASVFPDVLAFFPTDTNKAKYLKYFRADGICELHLIAFPVTSKLIYHASTIVKDREAICHFLIGDKEKPEDRKWTILGPKLWRVFVQSTISYITVKV